MRTLRMAFPAVVVLAMATLGAVVLYELFQVRSELHTLRSQVVALSRNVTKAVTRPPRAAPASGQRHVAATQQVSITVQGVSYVFLPRTVVIKPGGRVHWMNRTASLHSVTSDQPKLFDRTVQPRGSVTLVFTRPGIYHYHCAYHPYQRGVVIVQSEK